jgi:hypothetical protein
MAIPTSIMLHRLHKEAALSQLPWMSAPPAMLNFFLAPIAVGVLFPPLSNGTQKYANLYLMARKNHQTVTRMRMGAQSPTLHSRIQLRPRLAKLAAGSLQVLHSHNATLMTVGMRRQSNRRL